MLACEWPPAFGKCFEEEPQIDGVKRAWLIPTRNLGVEVIIIERRFRRMTAVRAMVSRMVCWIMRTDACCRACSIWPVSASTVAVKRQEHPRQTTPQPSASVLPDWLRRDGSKIRKTYAPALRVSPPAPAEQNE